MQFDIDIYQGWNYPAGMRFFIIVILFVMLWLPYLIAVHVLLSYQIKKFSTRLRLKWRDDKNGFDIDAYRVSISAKKRNRPIRDYFLSLAEKISVPIEVRNPANPRPRMEIDRFLAKRELHLRGLTIVVVFSLAGLLLFCFYYVVLFITPLFAVRTNPTIADVIVEIHLVFGHAFVPLAIGLTEAFLSFWLINGLKKMRLRLDDVWAGFLEEIAPPRRPL